MSDHAGHAVSSRERGGRFYSGEPEDRAALERQIAGAQASIQGRLRRIENEVGSAPKAVWAGVKKHPALSALAALAAGLLAGKMIFGRRRVSRTTQPTDMYGSPAASGGRGGLFRRFRATLLQTGVGLAADVAADFLAGAIRRCTAGVPEKKRGGRTGRRRAA